jgi:hypothetical protein
MNPVLGWGLAVVAIAVGYASYGWPGVALAFTVIVFWLLLQFSRTLRVMRNAGQSPVGRVPSAVMFNTRLKPGLRMLDLVQMTKSLGQRVSETPEVWRWADDGDVAVDVTFRGGRVAEWALQRPPEVAAPAPAPDVPPPGHPPGDS